MAIPCKYAYQIFRQIHMNSFLKTNNDCISKSLTLTPRTTHKQVPFTTASGAARFALAATRHQWRRYYIAGPHPFARSDASLSFSRRPPSYASLSLPSLVLFTRPRIARRRRRREAHPAALHAPAPGAARGRVRPCFPPDVRLGSANYAYPGTTNTQQLQPKILSIGLWIYRVRGLAHNTI